MSYFRELPNLEYQSFLSSRKGSDEYLLVKNVFRRVKLRDDLQNVFTIFNKYAVEVRYPLSLAASSTIYALGFFEAANGWYSMKDYNPFKLRRSVGVGMRFFLPMFGLLGFDYRWWRGHSIQSQQYQSVR